MDNQELQHHGIKGQKWGRRRFQNLDGSLTTAGKKRYDSDSDAKTVPGKKALYNTKIKKTPADKGDFSPESFAAAKAKTEARVRTLANKKEKTGFLATKSNDETTDSSKNTESKKVKTTKEKTPTKNKKANNDNIESKASNKETDKNKATDTTEKSAKPDSVKVAKAVGSAATLTGQAVKNEGVAIARAAIKVKNANNMKDYKSMTNAELKEEIERMRLENDFVEKSMAKTTAASHKVESILSIAGSSINVIGSAANTYAALMSIFNKD